MTPKKTLYLIDGANYVFRAFYAIRNLSNSSGLPTGALYGFARMLLKLLKERKPDLIAVCFDTKEPTFRDEMYPKYKANRKEPPDDLVEQFPYVIPLTEAMGLPIVEKPGFEADDIIGTLALKYSSKGFDVVIVSGDKDLMQLVGDGVSILDEMKELKISEGEVVARFGVGPGKVIEVMGLAGDSSDNIPGIAGVGPKTATALIQKYGSIEEVIAHADELKGALSQKVKDGKKDALLSRELARIKTDVDIKMDESEFVLKKPDRDKVYKLLKELEFTKLIAEILPDEGMATSKYIEVLDEKVADNIIAQIKKSGRVAFTVHEGMAFSWGEGEVAIIPSVIPAVFSGNPDVSEIPAYNRRDDKRRNNAISMCAEQILSNDSISKITYNFNRELTEIHKLGFEIKGKCFDVMLASYVLNPAENHELAALAQRDLNMSVSKEAPQRVDATLRLAKIFEEKIRKEKLDNLLYNIEMPLVGILVDMQVAGVKIDTEALKKLSDNFSGRLLKITKEIFGLAGTEFNINSPKQLGEILFGKLQLPGAKKTKTGFSTSQDILENLAQVHELPRLVLEFRSLSKLKNTYIDALPTLIDPKTGRIHTSFNQAVTATGRLSSSDPNLQNIPARKEEGIKIREAFIAEKGFVLLSADYSQIELRVLAHVSGDETLIRAFEKGLDIHAITASGIFGVSVDAVSKEQRAVGKTVNFATIYGQTPFGLSKQLSIEVGRAAAYIENYFKKYPGVARYRDKVLADAKKNGMVTTLFGRRRYFPDISSSNHMLREMAERMAFNTVFQGTAADIIKIAMIEIARGLASVSRETRMILQVHDELVFEVPKGDAEKVKNFVVSKMESAAKLCVPLVVDCGTGLNWASAH